MQEIDYTVQRLQYYNAMGKPFAIVNNSLHILFFVINYAIELFGRYIEKRVALP